MEIQLLETDLNIIRKIELDIVSEIDRICRKHDIRYSMIGGTLLGAVRHKGFIPWDDDIDLMMTRPEYDKFLAAAKTDLDSRFQLANYEETPSIGEPFTKIMARNTVLRERFIGKSEAPCGVFADIFPFDASPDNWLSQMAHRFRNYTLRKKILIRSGYDFNKHGLKKFAYDLIRISTFSSKQMLIKKYRINQTKYSGKNVRNVVSLGGNYGYKKDLIPAEWFSEYLYLDFEDIQLMSVKEYVKVLEHYFGDYMRLPPENERVNKHKVAELDLREFGGRCSQ